MNLFTISWLPVGASGPAAFILGPLTKMTLVLAFAWIAHLLLRRVNPRWRILLWRVTGFGVLGVALLGLREPLWNLAILPAASTETTLVEVAPPALTPNGEATSVSSPAPVLPPISTMPVNVGSEIAADPTPIQPAETASSEPTKSPPDTSWSWWQVALLIWALGVAWGGARLATGLIHLAGIRRSSGPVPAWVAEDNSNLLAGTWRVDLRQSHTVTTPCSIGLFCNTLLLPSVLCEATHREEIRAALAHELAHFRGHDLPWNGLLHALTIMLWFHPLAWRMRLAHADACDERCDAEAARHFGDSSEYGRTLARLALRAAKRTSPVALSMARQSNVGRRIAVLRSELGSKRLSRWRAAVAAGGVGCVLMGIGAAGLAPSGAEETKPIDAEEPSSDVVVYHCTVTDEETGEPIPGAHVSWEIRSLRVDGRDSVFDAEFVSDEAGRYEVRLPEEITELVAGIVWVEAQHPNYLPIQHLGYSLPWREAAARNESRVLNLTLEPGVVVTGRLLLPDGSPAKGVTIMVARDRTGFGDGRGYFTKTDEDGRFRLVTRNGWPQRLCWWPENYQCDSRALNKTDIAEGDYRFGDQGTIRLKPGPRLSGRVVSNDGEPVAGMVIRAEQGTRIPHRFVITDAAGHFEFAPMPLGEYTLTPVQTYPGDRFDYWPETAQAILPIPAIHYKLAASGHNEPAVLRGRELVTIRVRVVDGQGRPLSDRRLTADLNGSFANGVEARPVKGKPGFYKLRYPVGQHLWRLHLANGREETALYQKSPSDPFVARTSLRLGKITHDIQGITIRVSKSGEIHVRVLEHMRVGKKDVAQFMPAFRGFQVDTNYRGSPSGIGQSFSSKNATVCKLIDVIPGLPVEIQVKLAGRQQPVTFTVEVDDGQTKEVTIDITTNEPLVTTVTVKHEKDQPRGDKRTTTPQTSDEKLSSTAKPNRLEKKVRVVDFQGKPVEGAKVVPVWVGSEIALSHWNTRYHGEQPVVTTGEKGIAVIPYPRYWGRWEKVPVDELRCRVTHPDFIELRQAQVPVSTEGRKVTTITLHRGTVISVVALVNGERLPADDLYALVSTNSDKPARKVTAGPDRLPQLPPLPPGLELIRIVYFPADGPPMFSDAKQLTLREGKPLTLRVTMKPSVSLEGRVDEDVPRPVKKGFVNASVINAEVLDDQGIKMISWMVCAKINKDGSFTLEGVPEGDLQVIGLCEGFIAESGETPAESAVEPPWINEPNDLLKPQVFSITQESKSIILDMRPTAKAVIHVNNPDGKPIVGASVTFSPNVHWWAPLAGSYCTARYGTAHFIRNSIQEESGNQEKEAKPDFPRYSYRGHTSEEGTTTIDNLPPGHRAFTVFHPNFEFLQKTDRGIRRGSYRIELTVEEPTEKTVTLQPKNAQSTETPDGASP